jgi:hypothetical protein
MVIRIKRTTKKTTKKDYEEFLNNIGDDLGETLPERKSNGGRMPDKSKYGTWMKTHDPIAFNVGFREFEEYDRRYLR